MRKLHEVLAIEGDLAGTANKIVQEASNTFSKKPDLFLGEVAVVSYFDEAQIYLNTVEQRALSESVPSKLAYVGEHVAKYYDAFYSKEASNQNAKADIVLPNGNVLATNVPATVLLGLETRLKELRAMIETIPTLQPGLHWKPDTNSELPGVYSTEFPELRYVTQRSIQPIELSPATKEHKAQVDKVEVDVKIAKKEVTKQSGMYSPADKSDRLERMDILIQSVKQARQRANTVDAIEANGFGQKLVDYILG